MSAVEMAALSLKARGRPVRLQTRRNGTIDTFGVPYQEEVGGDNVKHIALSLTVPADVPVYEQDMAMYAGRDYLVRSVDAGGDYVKRLELGHV